MAAPQPPPGPKLSAAQRDRHLVNTRERLPANTTITERILHWVPPPIHPSLGNLPYPNIKLSISPDPITLEKLYGEEFYSWKNYERVPTCNFVGLDCEFGNTQAGVFNALIQTVGRISPNRCRGIIAQTTCLPTIPPSLRLLLRDRRVIKLVHAASNDLKSIKRWSSPTGEKLECRAFLEIDRVAKLYWRMKGDIAKANNQGKMGLSSLSEYFLGVSLSNSRAPPGVTWASTDLPTRMINYAVKDAWATMEIFYAIKVRIDRLAGSEQAGNVLLHELMLEFLKEGNEFEVL